MSDNFTTSLVRDIKSKYPTKRTSYWKRKYNENEEVVVNTFKEQLLRDLHAHYNAEFGIGGPISAEDIFGEQEAEAVELLALTPAGTTAKRVRKSNGRKSIPTITATGAPGPTPDSAALARLQLGSDANSQGVLRNDGIRLPDSNDLVLATPSSSGKRPTKKALASAASHMRRLEREGIKMAKDLTHSWRMVQVRGFMKDMFEGKHQ
ncbi:hypothetical protein H4Q26_001948 [Puccinia striiformis f. sp. tritici PST-130]|nr:hypothetical protein H4Q26_001948 [Puccinia striiformis f. sp. tritici PST-130]